MKNKEGTLYGIHPISEALKTGKTIEKVLVQKGLRTENGMELIRELRRSDSQIQYVPKIKLDRITGKNHQGFIAFISPVEYQKLEWLIPQIYERGETPFILVLDQITDVRNFGAICRTAECAGVHAVVIPSKGAASASPDAVKTSAGALLRIPVCRESDLVKAIEFLTASGLYVYACHEGGDEVYYTADLTRPIALIMGSEDQGIQTKIKATSQSGLRIPMRGKTGSLNVSTATGVLLFEALRQRGTSG